MPQTPTFTVELQTDPRGRVVRLCGEVHLDAGGQMRQSLRGVAEGGPRLVVLDLSRLTFITSFGLGVLLEFRRDLSRSGATLRLAAATPEIAEMLRKTRLIELFPVYGSAEMALAAK